GAPHPAWVRRPGRTRMKLSETFADALSVNAKVVPTGALLMCGRAEPRRHLLADSLNPLTTGPASAPDPAPPPGGGGPPGGPAGATNVYLSAATVSLVEC